MSPEHERRVAIWRSALLLGSETFIRDHGCSLTRYQPHYVGCRRVSGLVVSGYSLQ